MQRYEIATLHLGFGGAAKAAPAIEAYAAEGRGRLLGAFATEIGLLNRVLVLRGFDTEADLTAERDRTQTSANPFGAGEWLKDLTLESYAPFPFLPPVVTGDFGPVYEFRTYAVKTGGTPETIAKWQVAVPDRVKISPLTIALYSLDGVPRITHIWPFRSLSERLELRAKSVAEGVWPPKGGPDWLTTEMVSTIALPLSVSPLK